MKKSTSLHQQGNFPRGQPDAVMISYYVRSANCAQNFDAID
jgi:hypothetical protein